MHQNNSDAMVKLWIGLFWGWLWSGLLLLASVSYGQDLRLIAIGLASFLLFWIALITLAGGHLEGRSLRWLMFAILIDTVLVCVAVFPDPIAVFMPLIFGLPAGLLGWTILEESQYSSSP